jgi:hypothetical protein
MKIHKPLPDTYRIMKDGLDRHWIEEHKKTFWGMEWLPITTWEGAGDSPVLRMFDSKEDACEWLREAIDADERRAVRAVKAAMRIPAGPC